ncbi:hypothetical protein TGAMA5MH_08160 [Trichoderma gamsii]|uniref:Uncharacterized protein n=1 Tax=Trichoderma gamsii TaxID=398673 RepID=A0A2K0T2Z6_9HYPO|nr:hypothetical protein TGAMA5MH_08160 [Trichoderma gamsii]
MDQRTNGIGSRGETLANRAHPIGGPLMAKHEMA